LGGLRDESRTGIALAMALDIPNLSNNRKQALNLGAGRFHNATAIGIGYRGEFYYDAENNRAASAYVGVGGDAGLKEVGVKVGVSF
jgi:hypothetical protein